LREFVGRELQPDPGGLVIDIGSNDGYLLRDYASHGFQVLGIDPAHNVAEQAASDGVPTVEEYFSSALAERIRAEHGRATVVHANNVLAHIPDPVDALIGARILLAGGPGHLVVETPYVRDIVVRGLYDTIYHEHLFYYSFTALDRLLRSAGLTPIHVEPADSHGGSLRVVASTQPRAVRPCVPELLAAEHASGLDTAAYYTKFGQRVSRFLAEVRDCLASLASGGQRVAGFGAPAKASIMIGATDAPLSFVCDSTPYKQGRMLPGTRIPIVAPEHLLVALPEYCVILAWNYADAVVAGNLDYLRRGGVFIKAVDFRVEFVDQAQVRS
jgi:SAM-dependent methyltransferase